MRALLQRAGSARVEVAGEVVGAIERGLLVLLGVARDDVMADAERLARRTLALRIFPDADKPMNRSLTDVGGALLVVSQFTLSADTSRGRRPGFSTAAPPEQALPLYEHFVGCCRERGVVVATGRFGAAMQVHLVNDGPVTFLLE
ncbi:MAG: D-tyrosyl-tRNA(Tyr) deacylase [Gammaproteobacteria bacterium]|nr:MAG: D-tyrosyl-tRNA(Tyr) deacylase [Gammaproteobacteria bacterium]